MDALEIIMALMLTLSEHCTLLPDQQTRLGGENYRIEIYRCGETTIRRWSRHCAAGNYWSRPFLLENARTGEGVYLNRFGALEAGWHVSLDDVYVPACGA